MAAHHRIRAGLPPVPPDPSLAHAANWLWMLKGERPDARTARLAEVDMILHAEHGSNASAFAARVTVGTEANLHGAIVTALSTLAGPAHGGAAEDVMKMVAEIGEPENAAAYVAARRRAREPVTGFGHRVYRVEDPRDWDPLRRGLWIGFDGDPPHQGRLHPGRRRHGPGARADGRQRFHRRADRGQARVASRGQVVLEVDQLLSVQRAERVRRRLRVPGLVVHGRRRPRASRSRSRPVRMRVLTVPSGCVRRSAISVWVSPP